MKKMSLKVDDLAVESFEITREDSQRGTVAGHDDDSGPCTFDTCELTRPDPVGTCCRQQC